MLAFDDDDNDFSLPQPGSRLATLFSQEVQPLSDDTFKYKAPRDPNAKTQINDGLKQQKTLPKTTLLCAYFGHCFKLVDGQYANAEKLGVAVIGEVHNNLYSILLYVTKDKPVSFTKILPSLNVKVGKENFVSFMDDGHHFWSVTFTREEELAGFNKQVALAKWMSGDRSQMMKHDLLLGDGAAVDVGDLVEIRVRTFRLVTDGVLICEPVEGKEDVLEKLKLGKRSVLQGVKIWEEAVMGMMKLGTRLVIYPQHKHQPNSEAYKCSDSIVEEISLVRVKFSKGREVARVDEPNDIETRLDESGEHTSSTERVGSNVDDVQSPAKSMAYSREKEVLMDRIKKLGQPLPSVSKVTGSNDEGREEEEVRQDSRKSSDARGQEVVMSQVMLRPELRPKPRELVQTLNVDAPYISGSQPAASGRDFQLSMHQPVRPSYTNFSPFLSTSGIYQTPPSNIISDPSISYMMVDMKQQSLDMRTILMKTSDKIDALSGKVDDVQKSCSTFSRQQTTAIHPSSMLLQCEVNTIAHNISKVFKDNEALRLEVKERESRIASLTQQLNEICDTNQKLLKKNFEESSSTLTSVASLSDENATLKLLLEETKCQHALSQQELVMTKQTLSVASNEVGDLSEQLREKGARLLKVQGELDAQLAGERSKVTEELKSLRSMLTEKEEQLEVEREERITTEQQMKYKMIESDRTIAHLKESLMKRKDVETNSQAAVEGTVREYTERLNIQEDFHRTFAKSWEQEKAGLLNKIAETDKNYQTKLQEVVKQKNEEIKIAKDDARRLNERLNNMEESSRLKVQVVSHQKSAESEVIRAELKKLSDEYALMKSLAKDLKEKYDMTVDQHQIYMNKTDSRLKSLMNHIYRCCREYFSPNKDYSGAQVLGGVSNIIRSKTLEMITVGNINQNNIQASTTSSSSSSSPQPPPTSSSTPPEHLAVTANEEKDRYINEDGPHVSDSLQSSVETCESRGFDSHLHSDRSVVSGAEDSGIGSRESTADGRVCREQMPVTPGVDQLDDEKEGGAGSDDVHRLPSNEVDAVAASANSVCLPSGVASNDSAITHPIRSLQEDCSTSGQNDPIMMPEARTSDEATSEVLEFSTNGNGGLKESEMETGTKLQTPIDISTNSESSHSNDEDLLVKPPPLPGSDTDDDYWPIQ